MQTRSKSRGKGGGARKGKWMRRNKVLDILKLAAVFREAAPSWFLATHDDDQAQNPF